MADELRWGIAVICFVNMWERNVKFLNNFIKKTQVVAFLFLDTHTHTPLLVAGKIHYHSCNKEQTVQETSKTNINL